MYGRFSADDLMKKLAEPDGRTLFDFLVEEHIDQIQELFHAPFTTGATEQGMILLRQLPSFVKRGAKKENVAAVLKLCPTSTSFSYPGMQFRGGLIGHHIALSSKYHGQGDRYVFAYLNLITTLLNDNVLTLSDAFYLFEQTAGPNGFNVGTVIAECCPTREALDTYLDILNTLLNLSDKKDHRRREVLNILDGFPPPSYSALTFSSFLDDYHYHDVLKQKRDALRARCLFEMISNDLLTPADIEKYKANKKACAAHQAAVADHVFTGLPDSEQLPVLKMLLDPKTQLGQFMLLETAGKTPSIKRRHGHLFRALLAFNEIATEADADFCFSLAHTLIDQVKNKSKRAEEVTSALMTLLQRSLVGCTDKATRAKAIYDLMMQSGVQLKMHVFNAYSKDLTRQYLELLADLVKHGLPKSDLLTLIETPMQAWRLSRYPTIVDLVAYFNDNKLVDQFVDLLLMGKSTKKESARIERILTFQNILSIRPLIPAKETDEVMMERISFFNPAISYKLWSQGYASLKRASNLHWDVEISVEVNGITRTIHMQSKTFRSEVLDYILQLPFDEKEEALTFASKHTDSPFPFFEAERITTELKKLQQSKEKRKTKTTKPAQSEAPKPSPESTPEPSRSPVLTALVQSSQFYSHLFGPPAPSQAPVAPASFIEAPPPPYDASLAFIHVPLPSTSLMTEQTVSSTSQMMATLNASQPKSVALEEFVLPEPSVPFLNSNVLDAMLAQAPSVLPQDEHKEKEEKQPQPTKQASLAS